MNRDFLGGSRTDWDTVQIHPLFIMNNHKTLFKELPLEHIEPDSNQPRKLEYATPRDKEKLMNSIKQFGLEEPLMVTEIEDNRYLIIDGHRRYDCLKDLGVKSIICQIYPKLNEGELHLRRYEKQNNRRAWKPQEKSNALHSIKTSLNLKTINELAELISLSRTVVSNSLQLREQKLEYLQVMEKYELTEAYRLEFIRLRPKLRRVKKYEVHDIIKIIFEKVKHKVIRSSKDFRKIAKVFARAAANEEEIIEFLSDPDTTVAALDLKTIQSGFSLHIEQLIQEISAKRKSGTPFSSKEEIQLLELKKLL